MRRDLIEEQLLKLWVGGRHRDATKLREEVAELLEHGVERLRARCEEAIKFIDFLSQYTTDSGDLRSSSWLASRTMCLKKFWDALTPASSMHARAAGKRTHERTRAQSSSSERPSG